MQLEELHKYLDIKFKNPDVSLHQKLMAAGGTTNSDKSIEDLNYMYDADFDEEPCNIELNMGPSKAKLKPIEVEYVQWHDNLSEMKIFCNEDCTITYEYAPGLDCYWHLTVNDVLRHKWVVVHLHSYVVKLPEGFTVINSIDFNNYFDSINEKIPG